MAGPITLAYGEDGLTYWALHGRLTTVIGAPPLHDQSNEEDCLFIYRPSFGRAAGLRAPFGEFDAIIGTPRAVYAIEAKWDQSRVFAGSVILDPEQILRHLIFRWIRERWPRERPAMWADFLQANAADFAAAFNGKPLAPAGSRLAHNLEYCLNILQQYGEETRDVLLFFHRNGGVIPTAVAANGFQLVTCEYYPLSRGGIFGIDNYPRARQ